MNIEKIISEMTLEEKAIMLTGIDDMKTPAMEKYGIKSITMADGPHGARLEKSENCTHFPNLCALAASWDVEMAEKMGEALAIDCKHHGISMLLGPGMNIKRTPLCGRNFEYFSEDPHLSGEMSAAYIKGLQKNGVAACVKHYAVNNQEKSRCTTSVEIDERTLREIYLKGFETVVKKAKPESVMCAYNKINAVWCSENPLILNEILKKEWGYEGMVISDWGAVQNIVKSVRAGLDFQMPQNPDIVEEIKCGIKEGKLTTEQIDDALRRVLRLVLKERKGEAASYNRNEQHIRAKEIAAAGVVLLKNDNNALPLTKEKYKKIAVIGEFADKPLIAGQGSAEVLQAEEYTDSPYKELQRLLPEVEIEYRELYKKRAYCENMLWPELYGDEFKSFVESADVVLIFAGSMESEDTEKLDRRSIELNPNYEMVIEFAQGYNKNVIVVLQSGSALALGEWRNSASGIIQMWLAGEAAGKAIAEVLCGKVNPSGRLPETFPKRLRTDIDYPGDGFKVSYNEKFDVGYRYYDKHPEEVCYPFGFGLSYTEFTYSDLKIMPVKNGFKGSFKLKNTGDCDGAEVIQIYVSDLVSNALKPVKELKGFKKIFLKKGEEKTVEFFLEKDDFTYYNTVFHKWLVENGMYKIMIAASAADIRLEANVNYKDEMPYTDAKVNQDMIGGSTTSFVRCAD